MRWAVRRARRPAPRCPSLVVDVDVPTRTLPRFLRRCAECAAALAGEARGTVGWVGVPPGEGAVLVALAPRPDLVAERVVQSLTVDRLRRWRHLWLVLAPGRLLGDVLGPHRSDPAGLEWVARPLSDAAVTLALFVTSTIRARGTRLEVTLAGDAASVRRLLTRARTHFECVGDPITR